MKRQLADLFHGLRVARRFRGELVGHGRGLALASTLFALTIALELLRPWPLGWVVDTLTSEDELPAAASHFVVGAAIGLALILVAKALCEYFAVLRVTEIGHAVTRSLRLRLFRHLVELSPGFHARNKSGDLLVRLLGDVAMVKEMIVDATLQIGVRLTHALGIAIVMFWIDPVLAAVVLVPLPLLVWLVRALSKSLTIAVRKQRRKEGAMADYLHEAIAATPVVQALGSGPEVVRRFAQTNRRNARAGLKTARAAARLSGAVELLLAVAFALAMGFGGLRVLDGDLRAGELVAFLSYVRSLLKPIRAAAKHQGRIAKGAAGGERLLALLDERLELRSSEATRQPSEAPSSLRFEGVSYAYENGTRALVDIDCEFRRGEVSALVGESGAGKSTLVALALRLFDPSAGRVLYDERPLVEYDLDALRQSYAVSMQGTVLFGDTVRENLLIVAPEASDEEMWAALEAAGAAAAVRELPGGLDAELGAQGVGLSGGETRRLCFARALLRRAPVLIVDEPFAGLDAVAAERVARALHAEAHERIVLVVTHHLDRLGAVDRVWSLEEGRFMAPRREEPRVQGRCGA